LRKYIENFKLEDSDEINEKTVKITNVGQFEILTDAGDGLVIFITFQLFLLSNQSLIYIILSGYCTL
jgi:hypothetical protein